MFQARLPSPLSAPTQAAISVGVIFVDFLVYLRAAVASSPPCALAFSRYSHDMCRRVQNNTERPLMGHDEVTVRQSNEPSESVATRNMPRVVIFVERRLLARRYGNAIAHSSLATFPQSRVSVACEPLVALDRKVRSGSRRSAVWDIGVWPLFDAGLTVQLC